MTMPDTTVDRAALRDLIDQYHAAINHRDFTLLAGVFASDAVWEALAPINLHFEGSDAVREGLRQSVGRKSSSFRAALELSSRSATPVWHRSGRR
jgi:ketosteroid isomerase-like protein